jgi:beta-galactosidase
MRVNFICCLLIIAGLTSRVSGARVDLRVDDGWRFHPGAAEGAEEPAFDDSGWEMVSVPHCWGAEEAQRGKPFYRGPGWYRKTLDLTSVEKGQRYFLRFEAASLTAEVYVNGKLAGRHRGGFGAFCFEITRELNLTNANLVAVCVDNSKAEDVAPLDGDFSVYGGLYRPVHLLVTPAQCICLTDHGSPGVAWSQTSVTPDQAILDVAAQISNGSTTRTNLTLAVYMMTAEGSVAAAATNLITLAPRDTAPYLFHLALAEPHLWNGRNDPYCYRAIVELRAGGEVLDRVEEPLGLRFFSVDPDRGFFLNGRPYHLHGVDLHQDHMNVGWKFSEKDLDEDISLLKELGATVVRCAHYQHSDYFYSLCDRAGIMVWAEIPQVNIIRDTPEFENTSRNQLLDLIRQNVNHPSIFAWSLGNEIGGKSDDPHRELQDLSAIAHGEDPTRPTIEATMTESRPQMNKITDLLGWNIYPGWYSGAKEDYGASLDARRRSSRLGGFCVSEYGAGANPAQHEENPRHPKPNGQWHPEEWQAEVHEAAWAAMKQRPFVWGTFAWCMFDFTVNTRHEGGVEGMNDKGLVTRDRKTKKDAFYFYKANWSDEPVLYITSRRLVERTNAVTDIKLYSNAKAPELFVNGISQGQRNDGTNGIFLWKAISLRPGENKISATAQRNGQTLRDDCLWNLSAPHSSNP